MDNIIYLFKRIKRMSLKGFFNTINKVHVKTGKNRILIFFDIVYCGLRYQAGYVDYYLFRMDLMNGKERKTVVTRGINNKIIKKYNDDSYVCKFENKAIFNKLYNKYLNRKWLYLNNNLDEFVEFIRHRDEIIVKPIYLSCGKGVEKISTVGKDTRDLYTLLVNNNQRLIEEVAPQNEVLNKVYKNSVNTVRVVTLNGHVVCCFLRIGNHGNVVDNFNHGGMVCKVEVESGEITHPAIDKEGNIFLKHPKTKTNIVGLKLPLWKDVIKLCEDASNVLPQVGYVGWDVCIGPDKPCLIEANDFPGHDVYQLPVHRDDNYGILPEFIKAMNKK